MVINLKQKHYNWGSKQRCPPASVVKKVTTDFMHRGTLVNACLLDCSKAFYKFTRIFTKLIKKGFPLIGIKVLIIVFEEQPGWAKQAARRPQIFPMAHVRDQLLLQSYYQFILMTSCRN